MTVLSLQLYLIGMMLDKANAQTIDFVTSQFTFELPGLVLYPFFQLYVYYELLFLLEPLCTSSLLPVCKIFIERPVLQLD